MRAYTPCIYGKFVCMASRICGKFVCIEVYVSRRNIENISSKYLLGETKRDGEKNVHSWYRLELKNSRRTSMSVSQGTRNIRIIFPRNDRKVVEVGFKRVNTIVIELA